MPIEGAFGEVGERAMIGLSVVIHNVVDEGAKGVGRRVGGRVRGGPKVVVVKCEGLLDLLRVCLREKAVLPLRGGGPVASFGRIWYGMSEGGVSPMGVFQECD